MDEAQVKEMKEAFDEVTAEYKSEVKELSEKVKTLESKAIVNKGIVSNVYKGFNLKMQMKEIKDAGLMNEEDANFIAKCFIEMKEAALKGIKLDIKSAASQIEGTADQGGYLVLDQYADMVETLARNNSVMVPLCKQVNTISDTLKIEKNATECSISIDAEGTVTATSATVGEVSIPIKRIGGKVSVSNELLADSNWDISSWLTEQFVYAYGQEMDAQILNGTGTGAGQLNSGVLTAAVTNSVILAGTNLSSITADNVSLAESKLATMDANKATLVTGRKGSHYVRTLKDDNGTPIYQAIADSQLNKVYGMDHVTCAALDDAAGATASTAYGVVGNFNQVFFVNRLGGLELFVDPYSDSGSYNTIFRFTTRKGFGVVRGDALCRLVTAAG